MSRLSTSVATWGKTFLPQIMVEKCAEQHFITISLSLCLQPYLGTVVGGRRGVEIGPAGGGHRFWLQGGEELWASGGGKGGDRAQKFMKKGPKKELF